MREHALETRETSCVPTSAKPFFILVVHSPFRVMGYMAAPELSPQGGRARSHEARGSVRALPSREARSRADWHVEAPEATSIGWWGLELRDT
jgi:hypothetical protein